MANRVSRRLLGDGRLTQSMRNPTINLDDVATATIRLSPLSKSHRRLSGLDGGSLGSTGGDGGSFTLSSSLNMTRTVGADFSSDSSPKKDHIGTSAPGIDTPYLGQTMDELAVSTKVRVSSKKSRTNTVDFKAPRGMQRVLEHALIFTKPACPKDSLVPISYILTSLFDSHQVRVLTRGFFHGDEIRTSGHFDEMYKDAMNYAMVSTPNETSKELTDEEELAFERDMGMTFMIAQKQGRVFNEKEMCKKLQMAPEDFYQKHWRSASKQHRIRKGIYVAKFDTLANEVPK